MTIITADVQKMTAVRRHYLKIGHSDVRILPIVIEIIDETTDTDGWFDFQEFIKLISINSKLLLNFQTTESISNDGECQDENYNGDDGDNSKSGTTKSATKIVGKNFSFLYSTLNLFVFLGIIGFIYYIGKVSEWLKEHAWKACVR